MLKTLVLFTCILFLFGCKQKTTTKEKDVSIPQDIAVQTTPDIPKVSEDAQILQLDAQEKPKVDKDMLFKCYTEIYCAQKKGEMDKILDIYKKYGFETPQEFVKTWIEAAKDTDWITKVAYEVSKQCK